MREVYPETGVKVGVPIIDLGEWASGVSELDEDASKVALIVARRGDERNHNLVDWLSKSPAVTLLEAPWDGAPPEGPKLREAVLALSMDAAKSGARALVWSNPHVAAVAGVLLNPSGWQVGPGLPSYDLTTALLDLVRRPDEEGQLIGTEG